MRVPLKHLDGSAAGKQVTLNASVFGIEPHLHAIYLAVKAELANRRQGTASSKTRGDVSGGGAKPWRQKGTGRARVGSSRNPIWRGGGAAFGPKPRHYHLRINKKVRQLARKSVLAAKARDGQIVVVDTLALESNKTGGLAAALRALELAERRVMVLAAEPSDALWLASKNLRNVHVKPAVQVSTYDIHEVETVLFDLDGLQALTAGLKN